MPGAVGLSDEVRGVVVGSGPSVLAFSRDPREDERVPVVVTIR